jgi:hypothetical protein
MHEVAEPFRYRHVDRQELRCHWVAGVVAPHLWDEERWHLLSDRHVRLARGVGALSEPPLALGSYEKAVTAVERAPDSWGNGHAALARGRAHRGSGRSDMAADRLHTVQQKSPMPAARTGRTASKLVHVRC